jgi:hypothetical protein
LPNGSKDAAFVVTLPAGAYTVQVSGVASTTGLALVEIYEAREVCRFEVERLDPKTLAW